MWVSVSSRVHVLANSSGFVVVVIVVDQTDNIIWFSFPLMGLSLFTGRLLSCNWPLFLLMTTSPWKQPTDFQLLVIAGRLGMWLYKVGEVPASPQAVCLIWFLRNLPLVFYRMDGFSGLPECPCSHRDVWRKTRYLWVKTRTDHTAKVVCYRMNRANSNRHYPYGKVSVERQFVSAVYSTYPLAAPKQIPQGVQLLLALHPHSSPHLPSMRIKCVPPVSTRWFRIHRVRVVPMCPRLYVSTLGLG